MRRQLHRVGAGRSVRHRLDPRLALGIEFLDEARSLRRYRRWLQSR